MRSKKSGFSACPSFGLLATLVVWLVAFALPASASNSKTISLSVTPTTLSTTTTVVYAKITNTGNSTANSFEVDWKRSPSFTVISATASGTMGSCSTTGRRGAGYSSCVFTKQLPTKKSVTIELTVEVTPQCSPASIAWYAYAWTGAPGPVSQSFDLKCSIPVTSVAGTSCAVNFVTQPADAFIGYAITGSPLNSTGTPPVRVQLLPAREGTTVTVSGTCDIPTTTAITNDEGIAEFTAPTSTLKSMASATTPGCKLTTAAVDGYPSATSAEFNVVLPSEGGPLDCSEDTVSVENSVTGAVVTGTRLENATGDCPAPIPYALYWEGSELKYVYDRGTQQIATRLKVTWPSEPAPVALITDNPPTYGALGAIPMSQQEFVADSRVPVDLCVGTPTYDDAGNLEALSPIGLPGDVFPDLSPAPDGLSGTQYGCVYDQHVRYPNPSPGTEPLIQLEQLLYVQGDYTATRR